MSKYILVPFHEFQAHVKTSGKELYPNRLTQESILMSFPKNIKQKAKAILEHIMNSKCLEWNDKGEISINNKTISNSHITDLIKCSLYPYKNIIPEGYDQFISELNSSNIPKTLIQIGQGLPPPGVPSENPSSKKYTAKKWSWHQM
jgi:hypothetical protein